MARTGRAIAGIALIGAGAAVATGWWWPSTAEAEAEVTDVVRAVEIDNDSGNVTIRAAEVERTSIRMQFDYQWGKPEAEDGYQMEGDKLVLVGCGWNCDVDYEVVVPRGTAVTGDADAGNIELYGVASADVRADAGNITVRDVDGSVKAEADAGNVAGDGLRGPIEADADAGNIELTLDSPANVTAKADSGTIELTVPDVGYRLDVSVDSGGQDVGVREDPDSEYVLDLDADSGDVSVRAGER